MDIRLPPSNTPAQRFRIYARTNFRKDDPPYNILGAEQKSWFFDRLKKSNATWKVWGDTVATLEMRADPQNLPPGITKPWPGAGYAGLALIAGGDHSAAFVERAEIYDFVRDN
jgi:alkaline phosphatase D